MIPDPADVEVGVDFNSTQAEEPPLVNTGTTELVFIQWCPKPSKLTKQQVFGKRPEADSKLHAKYAGQEVFVCNNSAV